MVGIFNKKQVYDSVFMGQKMLPKLGIALSMFLMSFSIYFCLAVHVS